LPYGENSTTVGFAATGPWLVSVVCSSTPSEAVNRCSTTTGSAAVARVGAATSSSPHTSASRVPRTVSERRTMYASTRQERFCYFE
jgi:hypothetical protein